MHRTASPRIACVADVLEVVGLAESAQDRDRRVVQADADADAGRAEMAQSGRRARASLATSGWSSSPHLSREDPGCAQILDQLARKAFGGFGFRGPGDDTCRRRPRPAVRGTRSSGIDGCGHDPRHLQVRLTSSRRSLPDDVRGSDPGGRTTTSEGTTPHSRRHPLRPAHCGHRLRRDRGIRR